jgi:methionyl-tRNA formyltransferase
VKAVFFGTPLLAVPSLRALTEIATVAGVVCQPDRPAGRGLREQSPAVKLAALSLGLEVFQPEKVRSGELLRWLALRAPTFSVVLAYGRILPRDVLEVPERGSVNLHASLLPRYRGAAPIEWAIARGEEQTGISLMQMDEGLDTGPVYTRHVLEIGLDETAGELRERLAQLSADVIRNDLPRLARGELTAEPQLASQATLAPPLSATDGEIDWFLPANEIHNLVRGFSPKPAARTRVRGKELKIRVTRRVEAAPKIAPGEVRVERPRVLIGTGNGALELVRAQLEGKRELSALELVNGRGLIDGERLGSDAPKAALEPP